jgi:molecular chaperone DnaK (HSP70)
MVLAGEHPQADANRLLGRFDLIHIQPQPAQQPQLEVSVCV